MKAQPEMPQLALPGVSLAPHSDMDTSLAAARAIVPDLARLEAVVMACIAASGPVGTADHEGEYRTGLMPQTYTPRRRALVLKGLVTDSGLRRPTASGRSAVVWVVVR